MREQFHIYITKVISSYRVQIGFNPSGETGSGPCPGEQSHLYDPRIFLQTRSERVSVQGTKNPLVRLPRLVKGFVWLVNKVLFYPSGLASQLKAKL